MKRNYFKPQHLIDLITMRAPVIAILLCVAIAGCPPIPTPDPHPEPGPESTTKLYYQDGNLCLGSDSSDVDCYPLDGRVIAIGIENEKFVLRPLKSPRPADTSGFGAYPYWLRGNPNKMIFQLNPENRTVTAKNLINNQIVVLPVEEGEYVLASQYSYNSGSNGHVFADFFVWICNFPAKIFVDEQRIGLIDYASDTIDSVESVIIKLKDHEPGLGTWVADYVYIDENLEAGIGTMAIGDPSSGGASGARLLDSIFRLPLEEADILSQQAQTQGPVPSPGPSAFRTLFTDRDRVMGLWSDPTLTDFDANWVLECSIPIDNVTFWVNCDDNLCISDNNDLAYVLNFSECRIGLLAAKPDPASPPETLEIYYDANFCDQPDISLVNDNYICP